jgi:O-antigen/teichoic acid export membrane protein
MTAAGITSQASSPPSNRGTDTEIGTGVDGRAGSGVTAEHDRSGRSGVRSAARGSALNLVGAVTASAVSFFTVGLITNSYGRAGAGLFFSATAIFTLAANGARLGGESGLTFFVSRLRADDGHGALTSLMVTALGATAAAGTVLAVAGVVFAPRLASALTTEPANVETMTVMIRILAVAVPAFAVGQALFGATRGFGTMRPSVLSGQIVRPLAQLAFVVGVLLITTEIWPLAAAWAAASVIATIPAAIWLRRRLGRITTPRSPFRVLDYWRFTAPRALTDLVSSALERLDVLLVAYFLSETEAGLYGASNRLIVAGQLMMYATSQSMAPHLSASFLQGRYADAKSLLNTVTAWNVTLLWPMFLGLAFGADTVLRAFGDGFVDGAPVVRVLALSLLIIIGLGVGDTLLLMTGDSVASLLNHAVALAMMVLTSALLLPRVGLIGAAWAWALSRILIRGLAVIRVWQTSRVHVFGRPVVIAGVIALAAYVPTGLAAHRLIDNGVTAIAAHALGGLTVQLALAARFRNDLEFDQLLMVLARRSSRGPGPVSTTPGGSQ